MPLAAAARFVSSLPAKGREICIKPLTPDDDRPGGPRVVVINYRLWQERFQGEPDVVVNCEVIKTRAPSTP